jgi:hypothetical protein
MPNGGGFPTIPTIPVGGLDLKNNAATTYKDYTCTKVIATGTTKTFSYIPRAGVAAVVITVGTAVGDSLDFYVKPAQVTAAADVMFLCNCSTCNETMTGITAFDQTGYGGVLTGGTATAGYPGNPTITGGTWATNSTAFAPTIIGGGGLNN